MLFQQKMKSTSKLRSAFTLIEVMVVVGLLGIIAAIGIPSIANVLQKEGMRKAMAEFVEACSEARAEAILKQKTAVLRMQPLEGTFSAAGKTFTFPENVRIEILGVNFIELQDAEEATIRFFPNGTSDEFAMVLHSDEMEVVKISLDVVTGMADVNYLRNR